MEPEDIDPPDPRVRWARWAVLALLALGFVACLDQGADGPADPRLVESRIPGFSEIAITVQSDGGAAATDGCALLAMTEGQRARGLMEVTDLGGYVGMVFRFPGDTQGTFFMRNTPMALSIAFFDADGAFVSATDMAPCEDGPGCPQYAAAGPYRLALEVPQGRLPGLGVGPGSRLSLGRDCPADPPAS